MRHPNEIITRRQIASEVWQINFDTDTNFIDVAVRRLRSKIDEGHDIKLIHTVRGLGYKISVQKHNVQAHSLFRTPINTTGYQGVLAMVLCAVAFMTYLGINQILIAQQDRALVERIERLEILLQHSRNIEQIIARRSCIKICWAIRIICFY